MTRILDISTTLSSALAVWPGDVAFHREVRLSHAQGDDVDLSCIRTSLHAGTHADAPSHMVAGTPTMEAADLEPYFGPCEVIQVALSPRACIQPGHLSGPPRAPRVLFRTDSYPDETRFTETFNALSVELVQVLRNHGCLLVGLDTPSVDPFDSTTFEAHKALLGGGMRCLEGLRLGSVEPGLYELVALPLKVAEGDGSPVRAVLVQR